MIIYPSLKVVGCLIVPMVHIQLLLQNLSEVIPTMGGVEARGMSLVDWGSKVNDIYTRRSRLDSIDLASYIALQTVAKRSTMSNPIHWNFQLLYLVKLWPLVHWGFFACLEPLYRSVLLLLGFAIYAQFYPKHHLMYSSCLNL